MRAIRKLFVLAAVLLLSAACGTKGALVPPPGPAPKPVLDEVFPAAHGAQDSKPAAEGAKQ